MRVVFSHKDWQSLEEGEVTKTTFYGVQKIWFDPSEGMISLLLQSGWVFEHLLEREWEYQVIPEEGGPEGEKMLATEVGGNPRGYFRS
jgi:hypothetical protein